MTVAPTLSRAEIVSIARRTKSLMHREEMEYLCQLAERAPDGDGLEIGVYMGASLIAWGLTRQGRGRVMGIDDWSYRDIPNLQTKCRAALEQANVEAQLFDMAIAVASALIPGPLSFLFVDGDHTRKFVEEDIRLWTPKVKTGGVIAFHDYGRHKNGCAVTEAVDAWRDVLRWKYIGTVVTTIGFEKQ